MSRISLPNLRINGLRQHSFGSPIYDRANLYPNLDLDFATNKNLTDNVTGKTSIVTFSRSAASSPGTYVGSDGLIKTAAVNLALYSEKINTGLGSWFVAGATSPSLTPNFAASPDGKTTATKATSTSATGYVAQDITGTIGQVYTFSFFIKNIDATRSGVLVRSGVTAVNSDINWSGSTISSISNFVGTATFSDVGDGWYRIVSTYTAVEATQRGRMLPSNSGVTGSVLLWGAQLEEGSTATPYIKTTSQALAAPRFDHDPVTKESLGLLVEEARSNLLTNSESFNVGWSIADLNAFGSGSVANAALAPDGQTTADLITENTGTPPGRSIYKTVSATGTLTWSVFVKSYSGNRFVRFQTVSSSWFDLENGVWGTVASGMTPNVEAYPNGWYRISLTGDPAGTRYHAVGISDADSVTSYTGDGTSGLYIWGAQVEAGAFPTSYIPTAGTSLSRAADVAAVQDADFATTNLLSYSESFDVGWSSVRLRPIVANAVVAPDGQTTADYIEQAAGQTTAGVVFQSTTYSGSNTLSVFAKAAEKSFIRLFDGASAVSAYFDLSSGTTGTIVGAGSSSIQDVGNGWYRCTLTTTSSGANNFSVYLADTNGSAVVTDSGGIYLWGASLTATEYPVDYVSTRNLLTDSQDFERATWSKVDSTISNDVAQSPDGTMSADKLIPNTNNTGHWVSQNSTTLATNYTFSFYAKADGYRYAQVLNGTSATDRINFDLVDGVVGSATGYTGTITAVGNDWYKCTATFAASATTTGWARIGVVSSLSDARGAAFAGDNVSGILLWGAQLEPGTTATDYIRTTDVVGKKYPWYEPTEGTVWADYNMIATGGTVASFNDGTLNNYIRISNGNGYSGFQVRVGGATLVDLFQISTAPASTDILHVGSYKYQNSAYRTNILSMPLKTTNLGSAMPVTTRLTIGDTMNTHIRRLTYWPKRIKDAFLQLITE